MRGFLQVFEQDLHPLYNNIQQTRHVPCGNPGIEERGSLSACIGDSLTNK
eukprot:m.305218 g.305218  ORF g.305218 m.305218 type:complete len:50 (+) comp15906_c0_seq5:5141-5290(+)